MQSKTSSQLIRTFTETKQQMGFNSDLRKLAEFQTLIKNRSSKIKPNSQEQTFDNSIQLAEKFKTMDDHKITIQQFEKKYQTDIKLGLTKQVGQKRLQEEGLNQLSEKQGQPWIIKLFKELTTPFALLLWAGSILCFVAYALSSHDQSNLYLGVVLAVINLGTGLISFYQNMKSQAIMGSFKNFTPPETLVLRDGVFSSIDATKLVSGDIIKVQLGKKIPADLRIIDSQGMKVDNSSLTGQTQLLPRSSECTDDNPLQTKNIAFFSTFVKEGNGIGVVIATGDRTFIGQIANLAANARSDDAPLKKQIKRFIIYLTIFAVSIGLLLFCLGFVVGYPVILNFIFAIGLITANVPQGMIVEVTVGLTLTAAKLAKQKVVCKNLDAVQTLGSTSCICSDKTGTLTMNKMTAAHLWYSGKIVKAVNRQKNSSDSIEYDINDPGFRSLHQCAVVCSVANFDRGVPNDKLTAIKNDVKLSQQEKTQKIKDIQIQWEQRLKTMMYLDMPTTGDASESGLIKFFQPISDITTTRAQFPVVKDRSNIDCRIPFNSTNKYAFSINHYKKNDSNYCIFTKGAPQKIWKLCTHIDVDGKAVPKNAQWDKIFQETNQIFGNNGERVLGFAKCNLPKTTFPESFDFKMQSLNFPFKQQCFVGMLSLSDPPRDSVPYSVLKCRAAGIKVVMVTGDQPVTAAAIAKQCNIITEETVNQIAIRKGKSFDEVFHESQAIVIHGDQLTRMSLEDEGLPESEKGRKLSKWLSKSQIVFARTTPVQKLIIVKGCQKLDEIVAVTGDGVNDSPAIKKADIGISMGISGTDVAKDAADMILLNDDFGAIVIGVEEGRRIFDNLKKSICYALTSQIAQMLPFIGFVILQFPLPVTTVIVLYISIGTDLIPAISFAYEPGQLDIMTRKPRSKQDHLVTLSLMSQAYGFIGWTQFWGAMFCYYVVANDFGFPPSQMQFIANLEVYQSKVSDIYNPTDSHFGNTNLSSNSCSNSGVMVDWIFTTQASSDMRMTALSCSMNGNNAVYSQKIEWGQCRVQQISPFSNLPVCYTTEAIKYAQSAYFYGVVIAQIANIFVCKSRKMSFLTQGISNTFMLFSITTQILLMLLVAFFQPFNIAFGIRDNIFMHFGIPILPFAMLQLVIDQTRKLLIRNLKSNKYGKPHWFQRAALW